MKKIIVTLVSAAIIFSVCMMVSYNKERVVKPDTLVNTAFLVKASIDNKNYDAFNRLFRDSRKNSVSEEKFAYMNKLTTSGADIKNYVLLTFTNGKMLLVKLSPEKVDGEYKVEDVTEVPDNMKTMFSSYETK